MKSWVSNLRWVFLLGLVLGAMGLSGCASLEPENASERPWNRPQGWETGLPSGMMEGR
jgi:hypothetical protein